MKAHQLSRVREARVRPSVLAPWPLPLSDRQGQTRNRSWQRHRLGLFHAKLAIAKHADRAWRAHIQREVSAIAA
jgi:hypothetical protein